jgi:hypothetical protein
VVVWPIALAAEPSRISVIAAMQRRVINASALVAEMHCF